MDYMDKVINKDEKKDDIIESIKEKLRRKAYSLINLKRNSRQKRSPLAFFSCSNEFPGMDPELIRKICDELKYSGFFTEFSFQKYDTIGKFGGDHISISDLGVLEFEQRIPSEKSLHLSDEINRFLFTVKGFEQENRNNNITSDEIIQKMIENGSQLSDLEIYNLGNDIIEYTCKIDVSGNGWDILPWRNKEGSITEIGENIMNLFYQNEKLFTKPFLKSIRPMLILRFNKIEKETEQNDWGAAMIWMGSILEGCITEWGKNQGPTFKWRSKELGKLANIDFSNSYITWHKKMVFAFEDGCVKYGDIGEGYDWKLVDGVFRDARNAVHIDLHVKLNLQERHYKSFLPIFEYLISHF